MLLSQMATQTIWDGCIYGPPGCGKTCTATTTRRNCFTFDVDIGVNTAISRRQKLGLSLDNMVVWQVRTTSDFDRGMSWLKANMRMFAGGIVVLDSGTELQRLVNREVVGKTGRRLTPDQREWGDIRVLMENLIVEFRYMPVNFIMTCHEVSKFDADYGREVWRPSFDGRIAFEYAKHFSYIARQVSKIVQSGAVNSDGTPGTHVVRALGFGPSPFMHYKDRSGVMREWEEPDIDSILARMQSSTAGPTAGTTAS